MNRTYDEKSIESLSPLEFTRLRPGVYCGDTSHSTQLVIELFSNCVDEFNLGNGSTIDVLYDSKENLVSVIDKGQGFIPNAFREDGKTILEAAFSVLNTSGKYRTDGVYEGTSLGTYGIGSKISNFLSHKLTVSTYRDGKCEMVSFVEGVFHKRKIYKLSRECTGTAVHFVPSEEFFDDARPDLNALKKLFTQITCLCPGLHVNFTIDDKIYEYYSEKGLVDLLDKTVQEQSILKNPIEFESKEGKSKLNIAFTYTSNYSSTIIPYVNLGLTESGQHITSLKTAFTREINKYARAQGFLKEKEDNLTGDDVQEGLYLVFNLQHPGIAYDAQVKSRVTSKDFSSFVTKSVAAMLNKWFQENPKEVKIVIDKALTARKAREAAKKARENVRKVSVPKTKILLPGKLSDCSSKNVAERELFLVEGDSAGGSAKEARDRATQAILPLRGKILNVMKANLSKAIANAEIQAMISAFGLIVKNGAVEFDKSKLRYSKIIIMADADVDGAHIRVLFLTFIWKFMPELIHEGYVYAAVPPLYRILHGKKDFYLKDDAELAAYKEKNPTAKFEVHRFKGLGEQSAEELELSTMNKEYRTLKQITMDDIEGANEIFNDLMGEKVIPRKKFIEENANLANVNI